MIILFKKISQEIKDINFYMPYNIFLKITIYTYT